MDNRRRWERATAIVCWGACLLSLSLPAYVFAAFLGRREWSSVAWQVVWAALAWAAYRDISRLSLADGGDPAAAGAAPQADRPKPRYKGGAAAEPEAAEADEARGATSARRRYGPARRPLGRKRLT